MSMHVAFGGLYRLQVFHGYTDILKYDTGWFNNIITNGGMDMLGTRWYGGGCYVGSNGSPGAPTDTTITDAVGAGMGYILFGHQIATAPVYGFCRLNAVFGIGAIQGTIAEVGIGPGPTNVFSRAQLMNEGGSPITIVLSGIDRLTVTYELRQYFNLADRAFSISVDGTSVSGTCRPLVSGTTTTRGTLSPLIERYAFTTPFGGNYRGSYFTINGTAPYIGATYLDSPSGSGITAYYDEAIPYVPGSYTNSRKIGLTASQGAITNITAMVASCNGDFGQWNSNGGAWQFSFNPPLNKTQYEDLRMTFETTWARA